MLKSYSLTSLGFIATLALTGASRPGLAQGAPATAPDPSLSALRARIEADYRNRPAEAAALAKTALAQLGPQGEAAQRRWFLSALARDLIAIGNPRQALVAARQGQALVDPQVPPQEQLLFGILTARCLVMTDDFAGASKAMEPLLPLLPSVAGSGDREARIAAGAAYRVLGSVAFNQGQLPLATEQYTKALSLYDMAGDARGQAMTYESLSSLDVQTHNFDRAEAYLGKAITLGESTKDEGLLATLHLSLGNLHGQRNDPARQSRELTLAHQLATSLGDAGTALTATVNLADVSLRLKDYPATLKHAQAAMDLATKANDPSSLAVSQVNKGIALNRLGRGAEGVPLIQTGIAYFKQIGATSYEAEVTGILAEELAHNGDFQKAYLAQVDFKQLSDQILRAEDQKRMAETNAAYQSEKKQREIEALKKEQRQQGALRNLGVLAGVLGLSTAFVLVLSRRKLAFANRALEDMTLRDPLTGLANRRYLTTRIQEDLAHIRRLHRFDVTAQERLTANIDVVFMMLDLDHFKQVNDQYGHAAGDEVLKQLATILKRTLRDSDTVVRWGGEEFFVLAKNTSRTDVHILAERIREAIASHPFEIGQGAPIHKTCSIGFALYPFMPGVNPGTPWETITEMADQCLYAAKHSGRDMWVGIHADGLPEENACIPPQAAWVDVADCVGAGRLKVISSPGRAVTWPE